MRFLLFSLLFAGCPTGDTECSEDVPCEFGSICVDGVCEAQSCATSDQCGIEQFCQDNTCVDGCQADTDCRFGDTCDLTAGECVDSPCTDSRLDCGFGEYCSPAGECYEYDGYLCNECGDDGDCGGGDNMCLSGYCGMACDQDSDCPGGYDCMPVSDFNGNVVSHQCWTYCWLYEED